MSGQQAYVAETIAAMKRAIKRKAYESDSDSDVNASGNRGHKLQKRARYIRQGQISVPSGPAVHKEVIEHAGYHRAILSRNPVLVDEEGYPLESDDDEEHVQEVLANAAELDPYSGLRLERILAPLTTSSDLPNHPSLSRAYTSKTLTQLATQGRDIMHKENQSLWKVKHLLTKLSGDHPWAPCGLMEGENDIELFLNGIMALKFGTGVEGDQADRPEPSPDAVPNGSSIRETSVEAKSSAEEASTQSTDGKPQPVSADKDVAMLDIDPATGDRGEKTERPPETNKSADSSNTKAQNGHQVDPGESRDKTNETTVHQDDVPKESDKAGGSMDVDGVDRPQVKATGVNGDVGGATEGAEDFVIHPLFLQPESSRPDGNFGLPESEADDLRRFLQAYVQKQEEICRGVKKLYEGLLKADRLRKTVFEWSKVEGHCGPNRDMSDGEDWYDKEEWGLEEDLKKGHDDEEEEATSNQKKTRNRR